MRMSKQIAPVSLLMFGCQIFVSYFICGDQEGRGTRVWPPRAPPGGMRLSSASARAGRERRVIQIVCVPRLPTERASEAAY